MSLTKNVYLLLIGWFSFSFPLTAQVEDLGLDTPIENPYKSYNVEIGFQQNAVVNHASLPQKYLNFPIGIDAIYWRDILSKGAHAPEDILKKHLYRQLANTALNYPLIGIYGHTLTGLNPDLGIPISIGLATDIGLKQWGSSYWSVRPRLGLSYITRKFSPVTNPDNLLIGSDFNLNFQLGTYLTFQEPVNTIKVGLNVIHYSNGATTYPNSGLNLVNLSLAYQFGPRLFPWDEEEREILKNTFLAQNRTIHFWMHGGMFGKQVDQTNERFIGYHLAAGIYQELGLVVNANAKLHYSNDPSREQEIINKGGTLNSNSRIAASAGLSFKMHRLRLHTNAGIYLYKPEKELDQAWFQNIQLDVILSNRVFVFGGVTTHLGEADFMDFGVGYQL